MPNLNPFAISGLLIAVGYFPLFFFIFFNGKSKLARVYSLHILSIGLWGMLGFILGTNATMLNLKLLWNLAVIPVYFIPVFFIHAVYIMLKQDNKLLINFAYIQALFFTIATLLDRTASESFINMNNQFYWSVGTPLYWISVIIWIILASTAHLKLLTYYKTSYPNQKKQIAFLLLAIIGFFGGATNFIPTFGIDFYPYGNFAVPIHSFCVSYAILKYQLFDIEVAIKRSIVYPILITLITIIYLVTVVASEKVLQSYFGYNSIFITITTAFILGIVFIPLKNLIQHIVDKIFFHKSRAEMEEENRRLREEIIQSEKLKTISTLASGVAHEIKNPLTAINTFTEQLPKRLQDKEFLQKFSKIVGKEVSRINNLVHELLDYAKPSNPQLKPTNIYKLLDETIELMSSAFLKYRIDVKKNYKAVKNMSIALDSQQIRQALMNIYLNAIEAMPQGGELNVKASAQNDKFEISIRDTGTGIAEQDLPHIFDPFFTKKDQGTGLGLSVTHGIIEKHGGKIYAKSKVGEGTEFIIELPLQN